MAKKLASSRALTTVSTETKALGEAKLLTSGLTLADAAQLQIRLLDAAQVQRLHSAFKAAAALQFNYLDPVGLPLADWPGASPFYRLRYLEEPASFVTEQKAVRYVQEPDTAPVAYYPATQLWDQLLPDVKQPLLITEGELKAAKACKEGFPTIGLGGVHSWRSLRKGLSWLPSLDYPVWLRRWVYICFDSDYATNPAVCHALHSLAEELHSRGAYVSMVSLPTLDGLEKTGLDDYLLHAGPSAVSMLRQLLHEAEPLGLTKPLFDFNTRYTYVRDPGLVIERATRFKTSPGAFKDHLETTNQYHARQLKPDGEISFKAVSAADAWLRWPLRSEVARLTYAPGRPELVQQRGTLLLNTWSGWGVVPAAGDITLFTTLVDHLFTATEPAARQWFLRWCAYPLQYPGTKLFTSVVLHGIRHGTGKSLLGYTLGRIYGENFTEISQMDLHNGFNEWAEGRQLVMGDDVTGSNKRTDADFLKKLITQREIRINSKYVRSYVVPDCLNYLFTANGPDSFFLEDDDRRYFIHEVRVGPLPEGFYVDYDLWLDTGGAAAVFDYLLHLDLGDFNPAAPALVTSAKERMIIGVQSDLAGWVRHLLQVPDQVLRLGEVIIDKDLFTSRELLQLYDPAGRTGTTANGLARELARAGCRQVCNGQPVRLRDGTQSRYFAVRRPLVWETLTMLEAIQHLETWEKAQGPRAQKY